MAIVTRGSNEKFYGRVLRFCTYSILIQRKVIRWMRKSILTNNKENMPASRNPAQEQFELNKDNPKVQALLSALSVQREHVVEWEMTNYLSDTEETATYRVVFSDESEWCGEIMYVWQNREWIASSTRIPAEVAKQLGSRPIVDRGVDFIFGKQP